MEGTVKMNSSLPVKAAVSERAASVKTSDTKGDFTKLLQEKRDLTEQPRQTETDPSQASKTEASKSQEKNVDEPVKSDSQEPKTEKEEMKSFDSAGQEALHQEALQQAALVQMAAQIAAVVPEAQQEVRQPVTGEEAVNVSVPVTEEMAGDIQVSQNQLMEETQPQIREEGAALSLKAAAVEEKVSDTPKTTESKPMTESKPAAENKPATENKPAAENKSTTEDKQTAEKPVEFQAQKSFDEGETAQSQSKGQESQGPRTGGEVRKAQSVSDQETTHTDVAQAVGDFKMTAQAEMSHQSHKVSQIPLKTAPESLPQDLGKTLAAKLSGDNRTLTVELEPASLGKLTIRLVYEGERAAVSIMASNPKTLELLSQRATEIADILKEKTGQETLIYTQQPEKESQQYDEGRGSQSQNGREDREESRHRQGGEANNLESFAQQLRLGLI